MIIKLDDKIFVTPTAIAESNDVFPILGRTKGLDLFDAVFHKGKKTTLEY